MSRFSEIKGLILTLEDDFIKFYEHGNKAAGTRVRKGMKDIKDLAHIIRMEVQEIKNKAEGDKKSS